MTNPKIISEQAISLSEVKDIMNKIKKKDEELNYRAGKTEDYLNQITTLSQAKAKELYKKLEGLKIPRLKEIHINKIIDIQPRTQEEVKVILQGYTITVSADALKKIAAAVDDLVPKK
jgi:DNA-directed RNA polymerase subunit F